MAGRAAQTGGLRQPPAAPFSQLWSGGLSTGPARPSLQLLGIPGCLPKVPDKPPLPRQALATHSAAQTKPCALPGHLVTRGTERERVTGGPWAGGGGDRRAGGPERPGSQGGRSLPAASGNS